MLARGGVEPLWPAVMPAAASAMRRYGRWRAEHQARLLQPERTLLAEQRLRISREVHDVVAHTLAVVGVHLNVTVAALDDSPEEARAALRTAIAVRNQATRDLKAFVGELRDTPQQGLESVARLTIRLRVATRDLEVRVADTTFDTDENVFDALRAGASGFPTKEIDLPEPRRAIEVVAAGEALLSPSVTRRVVERLAPRRCTRSPRARARWSGWWGQACPTTRPPPRW
ncbi:histidine kinase [Streptosporangium sandarakinum]|uniref:histidine kinase n=1 Tax=Streptosporangium sandarakinum TaxID=1260955 RepID=UPI003436D5AA